MRVLLVDDLSDLRQHLRKMLCDLDPGVSIVGEAGGVLEAVSQIRQYHPDVVFLDVEMPQYSGLELFDFLDDEELKFQTVFVTAHSHYALRAFDLSAVDYLLKPVTVEALKRTLIRLRERLMFHAANQLRLKTFQQQLDPPSLSTKLALSSADAIRLVSYEEVVCLKANRAYTQFSLLPNERLLISKPLAEFEEALPAAYFLRIHRSYLVNLHHVRSFHKQESTLELSNGEHLPVSSDKKELLLQRLLT